MKLAYRRDVDGLRGLAVLAVIGFHAFPGKIHGGFVGVDIFFVISGFLISSLIAKEIEAGAFSLGGFYARRAKRIFPALIVVLIASMLAGWFLLTPVEYRNLGWDVGAAAGFVANFALLQQQGYFDAAAELKPLLHLWSLGIEEQFYIVWPLLLMAAVRRQRASAIAFVVLVASLGCSIVLSGKHPLAAFYLPFTRFWELALGAVLALGMPTGWPRRKTADDSRLIALYRQHQGVVHDTAAWLGIALLAAAVLLISKDRIFPGWWALLPTVGTGLLIFAGPAAWFNRTVLSHRALVYVGLISYPLYLWHWPMLVFARIARFGDEPTVLMKFALIGAAFVLADLTYRWIEKPIRFGAPTISKPVGASIALVTAGCLGLLIHANAGLPARFPGDLQNLLRDFQNEASSAARTGSCFLVSSQDAPAFDSACDSAGQPGAPVVVLWGDSYAATLFPGLAALQQNSSAFRLAQYTASGCPPVFAFASPARENCAAVNALIGSKIELLRPDTVIMAGRWNLYDGRNGWGSIEEAAIRATMVRLKAAGVKRIVVIGQFPDWRLPPPKIRTRMYQIRAMDFLRADAISPPPERNSSFLNLSAFDTDEAARRMFSAAGAIFLSPSASLCNRDGCLLTVPGGKGEPMAWDHGHLTIAGSVFFVASNAQQLLGR